MSATVGTAGEMAWINRRLLAAELNTDVRKRFAEEVLCHVADWRGVARQPPHCEASSMIYRALRILRKWAGLVPSAEGRKCCPGVPGDELSVSAQA